MFTRWRRTSLSNEPNLSAIQSVFHHDANNVGDQMCGPADYFPALAAHKRNFSTFDRQASRLIVGGGLIFRQLANLSAAAIESNSDASLICWGAGIPRKGTRDLDVHRIAKRFELFGTRNFDWAGELEFVPCVSCMSPALDNLPEPSHEVVVFAHQRKTPDLIVPDGFPYRTNVGQSAQDVLRFIASGQTVVTSSYHGVYWAQLLGRKVVCIPFNNKFETFEHPPFFSNTRHWMHELDGASQTRPLLHDYRGINEIFAQKVMQTWRLNGKDKRS